MNERLQKDYSMQTKRNVSFDALKCISISFVLLWHLKPLKFESVTSINAVESVINFAISFFYSNITLTAVPIFFLVSLYIFYQKIENNSSYLNRRFRHLISLYIFWSIVQVFIFYLIAGSLPDFTLKNIIGILIGIRPILPLVGPSVFYFLFNLIVLTLLAFIFINLTEKKRFIVSILIVSLSLLYFEITSITDFYLPSYRIENFVIYVPLSYIVQSNIKQLFKKKYYYLLICAYTVFSIQDVYIQVFKKELLNSYGRVSIVFGALILFFYIYKLDLKPNFIINKISKYSLGLYALHKYFQYLFLYIFDIWLSDIRLSWTKLSIENLLVFPAVLFSTSAIIYFLRFTKVKKFVS